MTAIEQFVASYGLLAVFAGGLLEGESILLLAAISVQHGLLPLGWVATLGFVGAFLGDQVWFFAGRYGNKLALVHKITAKQQVRRATSFIDRNQTLFVLSFRFIYGLRVAGAVAAGVSGIETWRFVLLNGLAAAIWTAVMLSVGYAFGHVAEAVLGDVTRYESKLVWGLAAIVVAFLLYRILQRFRKSKP